MVHSPGDKPLSELEDEELKQMLKNMNIGYSYKDVMGELRYREERNISRKQTYPTFPISTLQGVS